MMIVTIDEIKIKCLVYVLVFDRVVGLRIIDTVFALPGLHSLHANQLLWPRNAMRSRINVHFV